jgi:hypothetical protein
MNYFAVFEKLNGDLTPPVKTFGPLAGPKPTIGAIIAIDGARYFVWREAGGLVKAGDGYQAQTHFSLIPIRGDYVANGKTIKAAA